MLLACESNPRNRFRTPSAAFPLLNLHRNSGRALGSIAALVFGTMLFPHLAAASNCSAFTYTLTNGTTADAGQVMSNFNNLLNCSNNNLAHNGVNSDITSLSGLTTPLSVAQGGTGVTSSTGTGNVVLSAGTLNVSTGKTLSASNTLTLLGADGDSLNVTGNSKINQDVSTGGSPIFAGLAASAPNLSGISTIAALASTGNTYVNAPSGSFVTIVALSGLSHGLYLVAADTNNAATQSAYAFFAYDGGTAVLLSQSGTGNIAFQGSGTNIQAKQSSGGTLNIIWIYQVFNVAGLF